MAASSYSKARASSAPQIVDVKDFNVAHYSYDPKCMDFKKKPPAAGKKQFNTDQVVIFPKYHGQMFSIKTGVLNADQGGFPQIGKYYKDDTGRDYIKVCECDQNNELFAKVMYPLDKYNTDHLPEIMSGRQKKFVYQPCVRIPQKVAKNVLDSDEDDDGADAVVEEKPKFAKFKFSVDYDTKLFDTQFFICDGFDKNGRAINCSKQAEPIKTASQLDKFFNWRCQYRMVFRSPKFAANLTPAPKSDVLTCGQSFKIIQMVIAPSQSSSIKNMFVGFNAFEEAGDTCDIDDDDLKLLGTNDEEKEVSDEKPPADVSESSSDDEENALSSEDQEDSPEPPKAPSPVVKKRGPATRTKKN